MFVDLDLRVCHHYGYYFAVARIHLFRGRCPVVPGPPSQHGRFGASLLDSGAIAASFGGQWMTRDVQLRQAHLTG